ncbi:MAG: SAM-dependent chlorinase/fluorinase [Fibrobacteria bacterium]|nr:SAM-dependent chlorinase/fluorinase [Fibrobacteria bacterium]
MPCKPKTIAIITDFGLKDWYTGVMKGVISSIHPHAHIVDITHEVSPGDINAAAFVLYNCLPYFPKQTIFLTIVDPGVGSKRLPIVVKTKEHYFIAPDNGVLSYVISGDESCQFRHIQSKSYLSQAPSTTFHGRDIFAPAAAHLSKGDNFSTLGPLVLKITTFPTHSPEITHNCIKGTIIYIDHFGNLITNIKETHLLQHQPFRVSASNHKNIPFVKSYSEVDQGTALTLIGSGKFLEISVNGGNASTTLNLQIGDKINVNRNPTT